MTNTKRYVHEMLIRNDARRMKGKTKKSKNKNTVRWIKSSIKISDSSQHSHRKRERELRKSDLVLCVNTTTPNGHSQKTKSNCELDVVFLPRIHLRVTADRRAVSCVCACFLLLLLLLLLLAAAFNVTSIRHTAPLCSPTVRSFVSMQTNTRKMLEHWITQRTAQATAAVCHTGKKYVCCDRAGIAQ